MVETSQLKSKHSKSCGCYAAEQTKKRNRKRPFEGVYNVLIGRAKTRNIFVSLTYEEFLEFTTIDTCCYCGKEIVWNPHQFYKGSQKQRYNLDRKDCSGGYTKDNCVVCCSDCNFTKGNRFSYDEMLKLGVIIRQINQERLSKK